MRTVLATALLVALTACNSTPAPRLPDVAPTGVPTPQVHLSAYQAPKNLMNFNLMGDISGGSQTRLFRYQSIEGSQLLDVSPYLHADSCELMDEERRVAGHYLP